MTPRPARIVAATLLALLAGGPALAVAQETESAPASSVVEAPPKGDKLPRTPPHPETLAPEPCTESRECALRLGYGNVCDQNRCDPYVDRRDIVDVFRKTPKPKAEPEPFVLYPSIIPAIGYNPALGFLIRIVSKAGMLLGDSADTTMSSASLLVLLTTNKQLVLQLGSTILASHDDWEFIGDWCFLLYNQDTYGLSTGTPLTSTGFSISGWGTTTPIDGGQPMKFNLLRFHQVALRKVWGDLYVGAGIRLDRYFAIVDESLDLEATSPVITSHYAYSTYYGFNPSEYTLSGTPSQEGGRCVRPWTTAMPRR